MDSFDVEMKDAGPLIDTSRHYSYDEELRSPRTPTYVPTSSISANVRPFDPSTVFGTWPISGRQISSENRTVPPPPSRPLAWVWQCHLCRSHWPIGVTRRCLLDGHFYCSGETNRPNLKRKKKRQSCSSEFDYVGWREWGAWKRKALKTIDNPRTLKGCEICEFPSQCRYSTPTTDLSNQSQVKETAEDKDPGKNRIANEWTSRNEEDEEQDDASRYYSNDPSNSSTTFESVLATALAESETQKAKTRSRVTDVFTSLDDDDAVDSRGTDATSTPPPLITSSKTSSVKRRSKKKSDLSPIKEESMKAEDGLGLDLQGLVMPVIDLQKSNKGAEGLAPT